MSAARSRRLAAVVLGLYPPEWRARYAEEAAALFADRGGRLRDLVDLAAGAVDARRGLGRIVERWSPVVERLRRSAVNTVVAWTVFAVAGAWFAKAGEDSLVGDWSWVEVGWRLLQVAAVLTAAALALWAAPAVLATGRAVLQQRDRAAGALLAVPVLAGAVLLGWTLALAAWFGRHDPSAALRVVLVGSWLAGGLAVPVVCVLAAAAVSRRVPVPLRTLRRTPALAWALTAGMLLGLVGELAWAVGLARAGGGLWRADGFLGVPIPVSTVLVVLATGVAAGLAARAYGQATRAGRTATR
jgi:hypothetical protein